MRTGVGDYRYADAMSDIAQTADHALRILEELGKGKALSPNELCQRLDLNRTVVHRLLKTLAARGFVLRQGHDYRPGVALLRLASVIEPDLRAAAVPVMARLADEVDETVVLHVVDGLQAVVLEQAVATRHVVQVSHHIGSRHPLTTGASGRALLAFLPRDVSDKAVAASDDPAALRKELEAVRKMGYALSHDELQWGVHGLAVALRNESGAALGSLAILVPAGRVTELERHVGVLVAAVDEISAAHSAQAIA